MDIPVDYDTPILQYRNVLGYVLINSNENRSYRSSLAKDLFDSQGKSLISHSQSPFLMKHSLLCGVEG